MNTSLTQKTQNRIINFLIAEITITAIKFFIVQSIPGLYEYNFIANIIISIILLLFLVPSFLSTLREKRNFVPLSLFFLLIVLITQILMFPENMDSLIPYIPKILGMSYGCFLMATCLIQYNVFYDKMIRFSRLIILFGIFKFVATEFYGVKGIEKLDYNMSFGFFLVVPGLFVFSNLKYKKIHDLMLFISTLVMVFILGSRGSILAILLGCIFIGINQIKIKKLEDMLIYVSLSFLTLVTLINIKNIAMFVYQILKSYNINSRFLTMLLFGDITSTTNRDILQQNIINLISENPVLGNGILSDLSSHNIFLEVFLFFGIPLGLVISVIILIEFMKPLFETNKTKKTLLIIFGAYALVDSMFNLTVLGKDIFWIYIGLASTTKITFGRKYINESSSCR